MTPMLGHNLPVERDTAIYFAVMELGQGVKDLVALRSKRPRTSDVNKRCATSES